MGCDEWAALTPVEMSHYIDAWQKKREREHHKLEAIDLIGAQIAYHTAIPYLKSGAQVGPADFKVFRRNAEPAADPEEIKEAKSFAETFHTRMMHRAAKINAAKKKGKKNGKNRTRRPAL